jgi:hypothetical protein
MGTNQTDGRTLCSEILSLRLQSRAGRQRQMKVNLEEIWSSGALFLTDKPIRPFTSLWFAAGGYEFRGQVTARTLFKGLGYFVEMQFHPGCTWSDQKYRPKHLFNPFVLLANRIFEGTLHPASSSFDGLLPAKFATTAALASFKQTPERAF